MYFIVFKDSESSKHKVIKVNSFEFHYSKNNTFAISTIFFLAFKFVENCFLWLMYNFYALNKHFKSEKNKALKNSNIKDWEYHVRVWNFKYFYYVFSNLKSFLNSSIRRKIVIWFSYSIVKLWIWTKSPKSFSSLVLNYSRLGTKLAIFQSVPIGNESSISYSTFSSKR